MDQEKANKIAADAALQAAIQQRNAAQDRAIESEAKAATISAIAQELEGDLAKAREENKALSEQLEKLLQDAVTNRAASEFPPAAGAGLDSAPKV
jgi:hypothetical protein